MKNELDPKKVQSIIKEIKAGKTDRAIKQALGVSRKTVAKIRSENKLPKSPGRSAQLKKPAVKPAAKPATPSAKIVKTLVAKASAKPAIKAPAKPVAPVVPKSSPEASIA